MAYTLYRTAHSTFVKETEDFTMRPPTPAGCTSPCPMDLGATWYRRPRLRPRDPHDRRLRAGRHLHHQRSLQGFVATHTPDIHIWKPIFHEGEIVCFSAGHIHNTDMGGAVPASLSRALTEIHQEGIRFQPTKLSRRAS